MMKRVLQMMSLCVALAMSPLLFAESYWIDVRGADAFAKAHVENAVNIPHTEIADKIAAVTSDKNAEINLYCRSGRRAGIAKKALEEMGYTNVTNHGGYTDVVKADTKK